MYVFIVFWGGIANRIMEPNEVILVIEYFYLMTKVCLNIYILRKGEKVAYVYFQLILYIHYMS